MPDEVYEVVAQAARYWFLFLMALIAWRSYRWLARDRKQRRKRLRLLPDAGFVGEFVVLRGGRDLPEGLALPVAHEGVLGSVRAADVCVPMPGVAKRHLWFRFDEDHGVVVRPYAKRAFTVDGHPPEDLRGRAFLVHGTRLQVGEAELRLRMFAGFESAGVANAQAAAFADAPAQPEPPMDAGAAAQPAAMTQAQWAAMMQAQYFTPAQVMLLGQMGLLSPQGVPLITPAQLQGMLATQPYAAAQAAAMAQLAMQMQSAAPGQLPPGQSAYPSSAAGAWLPPASGMAAAQAGVPGTAVLQTEQGDFLPPPKAGKSGAILQDAALTEAQEAAQPWPAAQAAQPRPVRGSPLPPLDAQDAQAGEGARDAIWAGDAQAATAAQAADAYWDRTHADPAARQPIGQGFYPPYQDALEDEINPTFAPRVTFYPPEGEADPADGPLPAAEDAFAPEDAFAGDALAWPDTLPPAYPAPIAAGDGAFPAMEPQTDEPYEYADEDEAPRSLYVEPDEAARAKRLLWDKYLKGRREP